jgi:hypothetical protein
VKGIVWPCRSEALRGPPTIKPFLTTLFSLPNRSFVIEEGAEDASSAFMARDCPGAESQLRYV